MIYRSLGNTGLKISEIGYGSWLTVSRTVDLATTETLVRKAHESGINFFDTADVYNKGAAEEMLGRALSSISRHEIVLATKCFFPMSDDVNNRGLSRKHIIEACHASLNRLQVDYIDLYQCHRADESTPVAETCRAMHDLITQGKVLYWGVSEWSAAQIVSAVEYCLAHNLHPPVSNQPIYNLINRNLEISVMSVCKQYGLGIVVFSPLAQGVLTGKYSKGSRPAGSRATDEFALQFMEKRLTDEWLDRVDALKPIAARRGITLAQLSLAWILRRNEISCAIIGATRPEQLLDNCGASGVELTPQELEEIDTAMPTWPVDQYTGARK